MVIKQLLGTAILVAVTLVGVACSPSPPSAPAAQANQEHHQDKQMEHSMEGDSSHAMEHNDSGDHAGGATHIHATAPEEYAKLTNPVAGNAEAVAGGKTIFETQCVSCHGQQGHGDGSAAASLNPKPANLADRKMLDSLSDGYLFWRVSEGGIAAPFNSAMPAWKATMSEEQRWQVISYLRTLGQ
ncbi:MAG: cytochrome c [Anaerolineae bacterium]